MEIKIDPEFKALIPPQTPDENAGLKASLINEGLRDALITWNGLLLDGHHRYTICRQHNIEIRATEINLPDREAAKTWIRLNQASRRNSSKDQLRQMRIDAYNSEKLSRSEAGAIGGTTSKVQSEPCLNTAEKVAALHGVSASKLKREVKEAARIAELVATGLTPGQAKDVYKDESRPASRNINMIHISRTEYDRLKTPVQPPPAPVAAAIPTGMILVSTEELDGLKAEIERLNGIIAGHEAAELARVLKNRAAVKASNARSKAAKKAAKEAAKTQKETEIER
jgi:hypothetical protein